MYYVVTLLEACGDAYTFKTESETAANSAFTRNNSESITYAQIALIDAPPKSMGPVLWTLQLKQS